MSHHLITGGAGFIGSALAHRLCDEGHSVTVLDRFSRGKQGRVPWKAHVARGDVREPKAVRHAAIDCDVIWHLAYMQGTQTFYADPKQVLDVALRGLLNVLDVCEGKDLILVSSSEVYQNPPEGMFPTDETVPLSVPDVTNPRYSYGGGKIVSELATLAWSDVTKRSMIVRPHNIYGPDMGYAHVIPEFAQRMIDLQHAGTLDGRKMGELKDFKIQGTGEETRSFCYISDCIDGLLTVFEHGEDRGIYHLGNPSQERTISDVAYAIADYFDDEIAVVPGKLPKGSPIRRLPDIERLRELGFEPTVTLEEGLLKTLPWYMRADGRYEDTERYGHKAA